MHHELTEEEINDFIANLDAADDEYCAGDDNVSGDSDWDDIHEVDVSTVFSLNDSKTDPHPNHDNLHRDSVKNSAQMVDINHLFNSMPSNVDSSSEHDVSISKSKLSGDAGDESDVDVDDLNTEVGGEPLCRGLSEDGAQIQRIIWAKQRSKRDKLIERHVNQAIKCAADSHPQSVNDTTPVTSGTCISTTLAASAHKRKKAISETNAASIPKWSTMAHVINEDVANILPTKNSSPTNDRCSESLMFWHVIPTKIRVYRAEISSELWTQRTSGREVVTLAQFMRRFGPKQLSNSIKAITDLVVVGVIGSKCGARRSRNEKIYSIWCLSDLEQVGPGSPTGCLKLFLFGECHEKLWKHAEGTVVAILNPRLLSSTSSNDSDVSVTINSFMHLMVIGESPDYGVCGATTKSGQKCFHVINKTICRYCDYHVKKAYFEASSTRPGFSTMSASQFRQRSSQKYCSAKLSTSQPGVYTLPMDPSVMHHSHNQLAVQSNPIKLSLNKLNAAGYQVGSIIGLSGPNDFGNVNGPEKLTNHSVNHKPTDKPNLSDAEIKLVKALHRPSAGSLNLLKHLEVEKQSNSTNSQISSSSKKMFSRFTPDSNDERFSMTFTEFFSNVPKRSNKETQPKSTPTISGNCYIDLGPLPSTSITKTDPNLETSAARLRAIALVKSQGGIKNMETKEKRKRQEDVNNSIIANCRKRKLPFPHHLKQYTINGMDENNNPATEVVCTSSSSLSNSTLVNAQSKVAPTLDNTVHLMKKKRMDKLAALADRVSTGSAHLNLVDVIEIQSEQLRLDNLEKRDEFEQKLVKQTQEPCTYVCCQTCNYRAFKVKPDCSKNQHMIKYSKGFKYYFKCRQCQKRTISLDRYPTKPCLKCGESLFEKVGILAERNGPSLPHEELLPRGLEEKFLC